MTNPRTNPYVGPRAFQTGELLYGRDRELNELIDVLIAERIVLLHSPSGAGKSSLIHAGLIPRLKQEGFNILPVMRVNIERPIELLKSGDTAGFLARFNRYVFSALLSLDSALPEEHSLPLAQLAASSLSAYLDAFPISLLANDLSGISEPLASQDASVLIFDQFEEILTTDPTNREAKTTFFQQLGVALRDRNRWALFAIREDYLGGLDPYLRPVPTRLTNTCRLDLLGIEAALQAIQSPARHAGIDFIDNAANRLVDDLRRVQVQQPDGSMTEELGPYVEPVQLQVVCYRLWDNLSEDDRDINETDLQAVGDVNTSLAEYYSGRVKEIANETNVQERTIREWFEHQLITENGIRSQVLMQTDASSGLDNRAIRVLESSHLVRAEKRRNAIWFELAHDRLIGPVRRDNAEWFEEHLSVLQRQALLWDRSKRPDHLLLIGTVLQETKTWESEHSLEMTTTEQEFWQACQDAQAQQEKQQRLESDRQRAEERASAERQRAEERARTAGRLRALLIIAVLAGLIALAFGIIAATQRQAAVGQRMLAETASTLAVAQQKTAQYNEQMAAKNAAAAQSASTLEAQQRALAVKAQTVAEAASTQAVAQKATAQSYASILERQATAQVPVSASRLLAAQALSNLDLHPDLSALLGVEAYRQAPTWEARNILLTRLLRDRQVDIRPSTQAIPVQAMAIDSLAFSQDRKYLALGRRDGSIVLWDREKQTPVERRRVHLKQIAGLEFSPDNKLLASISSDNRILLWDLTKFADLSYQPGELPNIQDANLRALAFSPDGDRLAVAGGIFIYQFAVAQGKFLRNIIDDAYPIQLAWSPKKDDYRLASINKNGVIVIWDPRTGERNLTFDLTSPPALPTSIAWSPDGTLLAAGTSNGKIGLFDILNRQSVKEFTEDITEEVTSLSFSPDNNWLASGNKSKKISLWLIPGRAKAAEKLFDVRVNTLDFAPDSNLLLLAVAGGDSQSGPVGMYQILPGMEFYRLVETGPGKVVSLAIPDINTIYSARLIENEILWKRTPANGETASLKGDVSTAAFDRGGSRIAVAYQDGRIEIYQQENSQLLATLDNGSAALALAFSPDDKILAASRCEKTSMGASRPVCELVTISFWDLSTNQVLPQKLQIDQHDWIYGLAFVPGKTPLLTVGGYDGVIQVWDYTKGELVAQSQARYPGGITSLAYSPDGRTLASGGTSNRLLLWDTSNYQPIGQPFEGSNGTITSLGFADSQDNLILYSGDAGGNILSWWIDPQDWIRRACELAGRTWSQAEWNQYFPGKPFQPTCN